MSQMNDFNLDQVISTDNWNEVNLAQFSAAELRMLAAHFDMMSAPLADVRLSKFFSSLPPTPNDRRLAVRLSAVKSSKGTSHLKPDEHMNTASGTVLVSEKLVFQTDVGVRANTLVPTPVGHSDTYSSQQRMSIFFSQLIKVDKGNFTLRSEPSRIIFQSSKVDINQCMAVASNLCALMNKEAVWGSLDITQKNAVSGIRLIAHIHQVFQTMPLEGYHSYTSMVSFLCLGARVMRGGQWYEVEGAACKAVGPVSDSTYSAITRADFITNSLGIPDLYDWNSGFAPQLTVPVLAKASDMVKECSKVAAFGGSDSAVSLLSGMRGWGCFMTVMGKRNSFLVSAAASVCVRGKIPCIKVYSIGDIPMVCSSLSYMISSLLKLDPKFVEAYRILVPNSDDLIKVSSSYRPRCVTIQPENTTYVSWSEITFPSAAVKGTLVDYDYESLNILPRALHARDFVISTRIWGSTPWGKEVRNESTQEQGRLPDMSVYSYGDGSEGRGIISSYDSFVLIGRKVTRLWNDFAAVDIPLTRIHSEKQWLESVRMDIGRRYSFWLNPLVFASPLANVLVVSKKAADANVAADFTDALGITVESVVAPPQVEQVMGALVQSRRRGATATVTSTNTTSTTITTISTPSTLSTQNHNNNNNSSNNNSSIQNLHEFSNNTTNNSSNAATGNNVSLDQMVLSNALQGFAPALVAIPPRHPPPVVNTTLLPVTGGGVYPQAFED